MTLRRTPLKRDGEGARKFASQRSSMQRKTPLTNRSELSSSAAMKRAPIAPRSDKRKKHMAEDRIPLVKSLIEAGFGCEISMVFDEAGIAHQCTGKIQGMHERRKSSSGGSRENRANLIPACNACNGQVETDAGIVRALTGSILVVREGDPEWEQLGARADREEVELPVIVIE